MWSVVKNPLSQCKGSRFNPWSGNWIPHGATKSLHAATKTQNRKINIFEKYYSYRQSASLSHSVSHWQSLSRSRCVSFLSVCYNFITNVCIHKQLPCAAHFSKWFHTWQLISPFFHSEFCVLPAVT